MREALKDILPIQEFDMQMIQLMKLKRERLRELSSIAAIKKSLEQKAFLKDSEIIELKKNIRIYEGDVQEISEKIKKLEGQQNQVKKVDEFNALGQEISQAEREKTAKEQKLSDLLDTLAAEEDQLKTIQENLAQTRQNSKNLEQEIVQSIAQINEEGKTIQEQRNAIAKHADPEIFKIYEMLLRNKKDRVIVPVENRSCSGCHIVLTAQHENLVRKGERIVFCEHCSRIHYWQEAHAPEGEATETKRRRRRSANAAS